MAYAYQNVSMVETSNNTQAIIPTILVFSSFARRYSSPFHFVIKRKAREGRMMLKKYNHACDVTDVERGGVWSFVPQFGQK